MKDMFYGFLIIVVLIGVILFGADRYAAWEAKSMVMAEFEDDGTKDVDYELTKVGPLMYRCTGEAKGFIFSEKHSAVAGFDLSKIDEIFEDL